jgi:hypothetical protein
VFHRFGVLKLRFLKGLGFIYFKVLGLRDIPGGRLFKQAEGDRVSSNGDP